MTNIPGSTPPFPGFPGFPPAEMLGPMWDMMRLNPFASAFTGGQPGATQGIGPSLSMMSDMMAPLTNLMELDKRITDLRAVEQWLKLNLGMLQSAIQAFEVQRATLATLRAFGSFAQSSMAQPAAESRTPAPAPAPARREPRPEAAAAAPAGDASGSAAADAGGAPATPSFDPSAWWNLLQAQFNQIAQFAIAQPSASAEANPEATAQAADAPEPDSTAAGSDTAGPAAKRAAAKQAPAAKAAGTVAGTARTGRKTPSQPE